MIDCQIAYTGEGPFPTETLEALGFAIGGEVEDIFFEVTPPAGWELVSNDNALWYDVIDEKGKKRGTVYYQPAEQDRHAFFRLGPE